jgi:uncharacterized membrane protein YgdD (TMEM256/DUF423 family)
MTLDRRLWIRLAAVSGFVSVAAGAFAAHVVTDPAPKELLHTGAQYEAIHALGVLAWAALIPGGGPRRAWTPGLFLGGSALFSGSLGGLMFLAGWGILAWDAGLAPKAAGRHSEPQ